MAGDEPKPRLQHSRPDSVQERELPDRRGHRFVVDEPLDLVEGRRRGVPVELRRLLLEQPVDIGIAAVDVDAARRPRRPRGASAALPKAPLAAWMRFLNFFSAKPLKKAARSSGWRFRRMPTRSEIVDDRLATFE